MYTTYNVIIKCMLLITTHNYLFSHLQNSYGVMVLNTNRNSDIVNGEALPVRVRIHYLCVTQSSPKNLSVLLSPSLHEAHKLQAYKPI